MTPQQAVAELAAWIKASSQQRTAPLGGAVEVGRYAVIVPQSLTLPPGPAFEPDALPLWVSDTQAPPNLPAIDTTAPASQDHSAYRLAHIGWLMLEGRFPGVELVGLTAPGETLQAALDRESPGIDLGAVAAVFVPRW